MKLDSDTRRDLQMIANLCRHMAKTGVLPRDYGDDDPPPGERDLSDLHYGAMLLYSLWQQGIAAQEVQEVQDVQGVPPADGDKH